MRAIDRSWEELIACGYSGSHGKSGLGFNPMVKKRLFPDP